MRHNCTESIVAAELRSECKSIDERFVERLLHTPFRCLAISLEFLHINVSQVHSWPHTVNTALCRVYSRTHVARKRVSRTSNLYPDTYCKTLIFCCILISRSWSVENSRHFNFVFLLLTAFCLSIFPWHPLLLPLCAKWLQCIVYENVESESECKCLTCNQKPTGSQFSLLHESN